MIADRLAEVRSRIERAAARGGRDPSAITVVAVTKGHPLETARAAAEAGLADLGENRVLEAVVKMDEWPGAPVRWHLLGHLQRNKVKHAVGRFALIHSLDSVRLADAIEEAAAAGGLVQDVLVEVNVVGEEQKTGCPLADAPALVEYASRLPHLRLRGLMTMAPLTDDVSVQRKAFAGLRDLRDHLTPDVSRLTSDASRLTELSMGMSNDFETAVEEGATMLRLGTVLFGERPL